MWRIWDYKDITDGDGCCYFEYACRNIYGGYMNLTFSPMYHLFNDLFLLFSDNGYFWCIASRITCAVTLSVLVLAFLRRMLPPVWAWLGAAWWTVLPVNFNSLYEVHLFSTIPTIACLILSTGKNTLWKRALIFGSLCLFAVGVRSELVLAAPIFLGVCLLFEHKQKTPIKSVALSYGSAFVVAGLLISFLFLISGYTLEETNRSLRGKHELNIAQGFAFAYGQRHPEFKRNPWVDYQYLMTKTFGAPRVSFVEAVKKNPGALAEHYLWNLKLLPAGLQVLLFNSTCFNMEPDYPHVEHRAWSPNLFSALCLLVSAAGAICCFRSPGLIKNWLQHRFLTLALMSTYLAVSAIVIVTQRPRSSYLFLLEVILIYSISLFAWQFLAAANSKGNWQRVRMLAPAAVIALVFLTPNYYETNKSTRPILMHYELLYPLREQIYSSGEPIFVFKNYPVPLNNYLFSPLYLRQAAKQIKISAAKFGHPTNFVPMIEPAESLAKASGWLVLDKKTAPPKAEQILLAANWKRVAVDEKNNLFLLRKLSNDGATKTDEDGR